MRNYFEYKGAVTVPVDISSPELGSIVLQRGVSIPYVSKTLIKTLQNFAQMEKNKG